MYNNYKNYDSNNIGDSIDDNDDRMDVVGKKRIGETFAECKYTYVDIF